MAAQSLNCPNCGAAASTDSSRCGHCNSRLATISCPECFGMMFLGAKFCSHCGARAERKELPSEKALPCPRCRVDTKAIVVGKTDLRECPRCEGVWADAGALQQICADREQQAAVLGVAMRIPTSGDNVPLETVRYVPCPICRELMHRVNFARCSNVVVDVCKLHGTWFDYDELRRIVEFIRSGGIDKARANELDELERRRRHLESMRAEVAHDNRMASGTAGPYAKESALMDVAASLVGSIFD